MIMGQHRPEATECLGWNAPTKLGDIPLEIGRDELIPPTHAGVVGASEKRVWKSAPQPESVDRPGIDIDDLGREKGREFEVGDPAARLSADC